MGIHCAHIWNIFQDQDPSYQRILQYREYADTRKDTLSEGVDLAQDDCAAGWWSALNGTGGGHGLGWVDTASDSGNGPNWNESSRQKGALFIAQKLFSG